MVFILPDREAAQYMQNDLQTFNENKTIWFYPSPFKKENEPTELDNNAILERTEILNHIKDKDREVKSHIIVTFPEALAEKVIKPSTLKENTFELSVGEKTDLDFIMEFLMEYNFERTDFVYEPGSFSIRGGIIDIFSFASELPFRVELDDDTVESIRMFDPETQLSAKRLSRITIIPNMDAQEQKFERVSFFDYIPKDTILFATDLNLAKLQWDKLWKKIQELPTPNSDAVVRVPTNHHDTPTFDASFFENPKEIFQKIDNFRVVEWGISSWYKDAEVLETVILPQPEFNKNFNLLVADIADNTAKGITTYIFSDQARQIERLYSIFEDIGKKTEFVPIYKSLHEGFISKEQKIACYTEHQVFGRYQKYKGKKSYTKNEAITLRELYELKPGDYVTHLDHGVGIFSGLEKIEVPGEGVQQEAIRMKYAGGDLLYVNIHSLHKIARYVGQEGKPPKMNKLGTNTWENLKNKTKKRVKDIARDLIKLYATRRAQTGFSFSPDSYLQTELEASFIYEDTPDQAKTTEDVKRDMETPHPMDRLVCGDVGFGKTEIAIRAAFKAATDGKQVAVLVPTTILALQHAKTFGERLKDFPVTVDFISRFKTPQQQKEVLRKVSEGKIDILIGTHRILSKDLKFKNLGLLIVDEEQKFGVTSKEKLRALKSNIDTLTLTATPIPRTLSFSLMGARDMSIINTPPPNRQPVQTKLLTFDKDVIRDAIDYELARNGQVFFVHNRIKDIFDFGDMIKSLCPHAKVAVAHAQMDAHKLEEIMIAFVDGFYDVLVSTTIVESGLDIPNANTILINNAQNHGLSDLYQLRGRVGRSNKKAFCYLFTPSMQILTSEARKRLAALEEHTELGSGFLIAMKDLDIRGAGNLLGAEQSGFIAEIGFEMYQKILDEAIQELKEDEFAEVFKDQPPAAVKETQLDTDLEILIPDKYVTSVNERLNLYNKINDLNTEEQLAAFEQELTDRFGPIPRATKALLNAVRLKWLARTMHIDKLNLKRGRMKAEFAVRGSEAFFQSETFGKVILYLQQHPQRCKLNQKNTTAELLVMDVLSVADGLKVLEGIGGMG